MVQHGDDEDLALIALGEPGAPGVEAHVQQCPRCQSRVDQLAAVVAATRALTPSDRAVEPPRAVWDAIAVELDLDPPGAVVVPLERARRWRRGPWIAAAAVVGLVLGSLVTVGVQRLAPATEVVAQAMLAPIADSGVRGEASVETVDGHSVLVVSVPDLPTASGSYYEVWMATADTSTMVAIGTLNAGQEGRFTLPEGMDMAKFPVVDVSVEAFDGDTGHSAKSVVRGQLSS